jgi:hypothetical protein
MPDILERAACHEAGHAVTLRHFGHRISYIFITLDGNGITSVTQSVQGTGTPTQPTPMTPDHAQLVAVMAGRAAEAIQYLALPREELVRLSKSDEEKARDFVHSLYGSNLSDEEVTAYVDAAEAEASEIVRSGWPAVVALAEALQSAVLECGFDGDEAMTIMDDARRRPVERHRDAFKGGPPIPA